MAKQEINTNANSVSRISAGTTFRGEIYSPHDIRIDGSFSGQVFSDGKIVLGETSSVEGDIACTNVDVWGNVSGDLYVKDTLSLKSGCTVNGGLHVRKLFVELGTVFNGTCRMISEEEFDTMTAKIRQASSAPEK